MVDRTAMGLALVASFLSVACSTPTTSDTPSPTSQSVIPSSTQAPPAPAQLAPLTMLASLDEPPVDWTEVTFIPAGNAESEVGFEPCSDCVLPVPAALAVSKDGSFWIADPLKHRIAHFSPEGTFLAAIPVERGPADLAFVGNRLYALLDAGEPTIVRVGRGGVSKEITANDDGRPLHVQGLIGGQEELVTLIAGAGRLLGAYWAMATVDPVNGQVAATPGAQVSDHRFMDFAPLVDTDEADYEIRWSDGTDTTQERVIRFQLTKNGQDVRTSVGDTYLRTATPTGFATLVSLGGRQGLPAGRWFMEVPADGGRPTFERVPQQGFIGDALRYLAVGGDGTIYWMRLLNDGLHVYQREPK